VPGLRNSALPDGSDGATAGLGPGGGDAPALPNVEHHIKEEESEMFDKLRELSSRRLTQAAKTWEAQKSSAGEGKKSR
jgi:hypothetical protein